MFGGKQLFAFVAASAVSIHSSNADVHTFYIPFRCKPLQAGIRITTIVVSSANTVVKFDRVYGAADTRGDGNVGELTIPTGTAVGKVAYTETDYNVIGTSIDWVESLNAGDKVVVEVVTLAVTTGEGVPYLLVEVDPERPANNTAMVDCTL